MALSDQRGGAGALLIPGEHEPQIESKAAQPISVFQLVSRGDPLVVMMYVRFPLSLRNVEDLLFERDIDICHETVRF